MPQPELADAGRPQPFNPAKRLARRLGLTGAARKLLGPVNRMRAGNEGGLMRIKGWIQERHCKPLTDPPFVPASEADFMRDDDTVLGIEFNGDARAYPWWIMDNHHVANDIVGGQPIEVILCEVCSSAVAFDPMVNGQRLTFQMSHIFNGTNAMHDHQTGSIWSPFYAKAIRGPMKGTTMEVLPLQQMDWGLWKKLHPETKVLPAHLGSRTGHGSGQTMGSPGVMPPMRKTVANWDTRLEHNTLVLGVKAEDGKKVYPLDYLRERGVVNDTLGTSPIVVLFRVEEGSYAGLAFSRVVDGRTLTFKRTPEGPVDEETNSKWSMEGKAVSGPLEGTQLDYVSCHVSEFYIWGAHYKDIEIAS